MALVLGLTVGKEVWFNSIKVSLESIKTPTRYVLRVHGAAMDHTYEVDNASRTEILPNVFVSAGPTIRPGWAKLVIEAPMSVNIQRGDILRKEA